MVSRYLRAIGSLVLIFSILPVLAQRTVGLVSQQEDLVSPGYNLIYPHNQSTVFLIDNCGEVVHRWDDDTIWRPGNGVYVLPNGDLVKTKRNNSPINDPIWAGGGGAIVEVLGWDNVLKYSFFLNDSTARLHHDVAPLPNGNILMVAWENFSEPEALAVGRIPGTMAQNKLWSEMILEWDPVQDSIVWEWHVWDHLVQDADPSLPNFDDVPSRPERIDINFDTHNGHPDWLHINSIAYNETLDQIAVSVPYFNELWIIDHSTSTEEAKTSSGGESGKGGDLLFRWGNPAAYQAGDSLDQRFFFQHDVKWIDPKAGPGSPVFGRVTAFNNRVASTISTGVVIHTGLDTSSFSYPFSAGRFGPDTAELVVVHPGGIPQSSSSSVSSFQQLPDGNFLFCAGRWGYGYEITSEDELVWEYFLPLRAGQPVSYDETLDINDNFTFRIDRYPVDYPGFQGRELNAIGPIEQGDATGLCDLATTVSSVGKETNKVTIFPNPSVDHFRIQYDGPFPARGQLIQLDGRVVQTVQIRENNQRIDRKGLASGVYVFRVEGQTVKLVLK